MRGPMQPVRGTRRLARSLAPGAGQAGLTLIELIVAFSLMLILSAMALPVARVKVVREKERRLREALHEIREAIDRHKDMADEGQLGQLDPDNFGYPASLEVLVDGAELEATRNRLSAGSPGIGLETSRAMREQSTGRRGFGGGVGRENTFGSRRESRDGDSLLRRDPLAREDEGPETVRFLRSIPLDPMTGRREWGLLSVSDNPDSRSWSGRNVFDVYSLSSAISLDGSRYSEW